MPAPRQEFLAERDDLFVIHDFLSLEECEHYTALSESVGFGDAPITSSAGPVMRKDIRNNDRVMIDDPQLAEAMWARLRPFFPERVQFWLPVGLNERWRFYRYDPGQQFDWHFDGAYERSPLERSAFTFMLYLNGGVAGGATEFNLRSRGGVQNDDPIIRVQPESGKALIFPHRILHRGAPVADGRKYVLRTDVMCRWADRVGVSHARPNSRHLRRARAPGALPRSYSCCIVLASHVAPTLVRSRGMVAVRRPPVQEYTPVPSPGLSNLSKLSQLSQPKAPPLAVGQCELIGRGGIGISEVYRARHPEGGLVAVYLFPDGPNIQTTLQAVLASTSSLDHPNVVRVSDAGRESGYGYVITEWVEGTTLARMLEMHGRLPEANVIRFLAQVGQAIDSARQGDVAPCRVSAQNILVRNDGVAKVIPFALPADQDTPAAPNPALLKPEFAAELAAKRTGPKTIPFHELVFSLGTTLFEALTGMVWTPPPPPPPAGRRRRPEPRPVGLTDRTERAVVRATDPDPAKRPESCAAFLQLLRTRTPSAGAVKPDVRPASTAGEDRRGFVRYSLGVGANCRINTSLFDMEDAPGSQVLWPLVVQDVSAGGIGILLARRCEPGTELTIDVPGADRTIHRLLVRVVRVRKDNFGHWMHGCEFLTPLEEPQLAVLLTQLGRNEPA